MPGRKVLIAAKYGMIAYGHKKEAVYTASF